MAQEMKTIFNKQYRELGCSYSKCVRTASGSGWWSGQGCRVAARSGRCFQCSQSPPSIQPKCDPGGQRLSGPLAVCPCTCSWRCCEEEEWIAEKVVKLRMERSCRFRPRVAVGVRDVEELGRIVLLYLLCSNLGHVLNPVVGSRAVRHDVRHGTCASREASVARRCNRELGEGLGAVSVRAV